MDANAALAKSTDRIAALSPPHPNGGRLRCCRRGRTGGVRGCGRSVVCAAFPNFHEPDYSDSLKQGIDVIRRRARFEEKLSADH